MTSWGKLACTAAALMLTVAGCAAPAQPADENIQAKADAYSAKVENELAAKVKAAAEALTVRVPFPKDRPLRVLFAGDSLTAGYYASTQAKGFSRLVTAKLETRGEVEVEFGSKAGATLSTVGNMVSVPSGLDLAVVELGTNDVSKKTPVREFAKQYAALLGKVKAQSPKVAILCVSVWQGMAAGDPYNLAVREQCAAKGGKYVDVNNVYTRPGNRGPAGVKTWVGASDEFHPSDQGHKDLANAIIGRIVIS
jgi:acyl-CoA thioesterase-1